MQLIPWIKTTADLFSQMTLPPLKARVVGAVDFLPFSLTYPSIQILFLGIEVLESIFMKNDKTNTFVLLRYSIDTRGCCALTMIYKSAPFAFSRERD